MSAKEVGIAVSENGKVVSLNVEEGENKVFPAETKTAAFLVVETCVALPAVFIEDERDVNECKEDIVEEILKGWKRSSEIDEKSRKGVCACNAKRKDLSVDYKLAALVKREDDIAHPRTSTIQNSLVVI